ncbi:MAG: thioredoxin fold domain-containing protein [Pseudomonadales bacterium]|nr:thioredoxin fold domain-containing protein [Pseudomonadales bacterium]
MITLLLILSTLVNAGSEENREIVYVSNLAKESAAAVDAGKIFLLYVSRPDCPHCERLKKDVLHPLLKGNRFGEDLVLRELSLVDLAIMGFDNKIQTANELLAKYEIVGTPTLLFLDQNGGQLTDKMSGYFSKDFYWSYFERGIEKAVAELRNPERIDL